MARITALGSGKTISGGASSGEEGKAERTRVTNANNRVLRRQKAAGEEGYV